MNFKFVVWAKWLCLYNTKHLRSKQKAYCDMTGQMCVVSCIHPNSLCVNPHDTGVVLPVSAHRWGVHLEEKTRGPIRQRCAQFIVPPGQKGEHMFSPLDAVQLPTHGMEYDPTENVPQPESCKSLQINRCPQIAIWFQSQSTVMYP